MTMPAGRPVTVHPIEAESYRILARRVDLSRFGPLARAVVARVIHASADRDYATGMVLSEADVAAGVAALARGAPVVTDVEMTRRGVTGVHALCYLDRVTATPPSPRLTRSAAGMRLAARHHPDGGVVVVGCAPTALEEVVRLHEQEGFAPALVIGLPVGFVGAAEAKARLRATALPAVTNVGEKGGSAVASAAVNAIVRLAHGHAAIGRSQVRPGDRSGEGQ